MTTHFMDEADMLGDRIAIIAQGQLKCCGSSLFLKRRIGSGYYLTLVRSDADEASGDATRVTAVDCFSNSFHLLELFTQVIDADASSASDDIGSRGIEAIVKRHILNAVAIRNVGSDFVFCLPDLDGNGHQQREKFAGLFDDLDQNMNRFGFNSYGVSDTTLEEVSLLCSIFVPFYNSTNRCEIQIFLKVANDPSDLKEPQQQDELPGKVLDFLLKNKLIDFCFANSNVKVGIVFILYRSGLGIRMSFTRLCLITCVVQFVCFALCFSLASVALRAVTALNFEGKQTCLCKSLRPLLFPALACSPLVVYRLREGL